MHVVSDNIDRSKLKPHVPSSERKRDLVRKRRIPPVHNFVPTRETAARSVPRLKSEVHDDGRLKAARKTKGGVYSDSHRKSKTERHTKLTGVKGEMESITRKCIGRHETTLKSPTDITAQHQITSTPISTRLSWQLHVCTLVCITCLVCQSAEAEGEDLRLDVRIAFHNQVDRLAGWWRRW